MGRRPLRLGLRGDLVATLALTTVLSTLVVGEIALEVARARALDAERALASALASELGVAVALAGTDRSSVARALSSAGPSGAGRETLAVDPQRRLLGRWPGGASGGPRSLGPDPELALALAGERPPVAREADGALRAWAPARAPDGRTIGAVRVVVSPTASAATAIGGSRALLLGLTLLTGASLLGLSALFLRRRLVTPIAALERAARRVADGELGHVVDDREPGELGALARAFNQMTGSLRASREQLIRSERLASVGTLAAGVAHEIGNPLAAVLGYVELLRADAASSPGRETLERIARELERIDRLIRDLLAYARPSREAVGPVDLGAVVDAALALVRPQARFRDVEVRRALEGVPPVAASAARLTQVLVNLLLNAADAQAGASHVALRARPEGSDVLLEIEDGGAGVPEADRPKIFEPFYTTKDPGRGTGLGLPISLAIVESFGGTLELSPQRSGVGATFTVRLPRWVSPPDTGARAR